MQTYVNNILRTFRNWTKCAHAHRRSLSVHLQVSYESEVIQDRKNSPPGNHCSHPTHKAVYCWDLAHIILHFEDISARNALSPLQLSNVSLLWVSVMSLKSVASNQNGFLLLRCLHWENLPHFITVSCSYQRRHTLYTIVAL